MVEQVAPGATVRSKTFIRESAVFDRIEWVGDPAVEAAEAIPQHWVRFNQTLPGRSKVGCVISLIVALFAGTLAYLTLRG